MGFGRKIERVFERKMRPLKDVQFCQRSRKVQILTTEIHKVPRGLKSEPDTGIG